MPVARSCATMASRLRTRKVDHPGFGGVGAKVIGRFGERCEGGWSGGLLPGQLVGRRYGRDAQVVGRAEEKPSDADLFHVIIMPECVSRGHL
jgi:hypothetical protein